MFCFVQAKPSNTVITFEPPSPAETSREVTIKCTSDGHPEPTYTIKHNGKKISAKKMWKIAQVKQSDAGTYECYVENRLGNDSQSKNLTVRGTTSHFIHTAWQMTKVGINVHLSIAIWFSIT